MNIFISIAFCDLLLMPKEVLDVNKIFLFNEKEISGWGTWPALGVQSGARVKAGGPRNPLLLLHSYAFLGEETRKLRDGRHSSAPRPRC